MRSVSARPAPMGRCSSGWFVLSILLVGMLLAWVWRFRPALWHRDNVLFLVGLLVAGATLALKVTAGRSILQFFLPTAAIGMLLAVLLDASIATIVIAIIAVIGGAVNGSSLEFTTYTFLGGMAGIIAVRKGDRLQVFVQAAVAVFIVQAAVVTVFTLLGEGDVQGPARTVVRLGGQRRWVRRGGGRPVRRPRVRLRHPDRVPASRAGEPVPAPPAAAAGRDAGDVPPLADGRKPRRARRGGDRRGPTGHACRRVLPRHREAGEPARVHREPGRRREHPRRAGPRSQRPDREAARRGRHRPRLQGEAAEGAHRLYPAASRDRDHELLLLEGSRTGRGAVRRGRHGRGRQGRGGGGRAQVPSRRTRSRRRARRR